VVLRLALHAGLIQIAFTYLLFKITSPAELQIARSVSPKFEGRIKIPVGKKAVPLKEEKARN
jgi:xanthosine utilization system XapX-like protein